MTEKKHYQSEKLISFNEFEYFTARDKDFREVIEKQFVMDTLYKLDINVLKELVNLKYTNPANMMVNNLDQHNEREELLSRQVIKLSANFFM